MRLRSLLMVLFTAAAAIASPLHAEVTELRIARQYGISFIQFMVMEDQQLVEKHARASGLGEINVTWTRLTGAGAMNDALLAGELDVMATGVPALIILWAKTQSSLGVKGLSGMNFVPQYLNTRNPNVNSIRDFSDADRIAVPTIQVSGQAMLLQMAAAREYGSANYGELDRLTVSMPHPEATASILSGAGEITAHFTVPPFHYRQLAKPGVRTITTSREILGGSHSIIANVATRSFHDKNPKLVGAFLAALIEATEFVNRDKRAAAEIYVKIASDKSDLEVIYRMLSDPDNEFTITPRAFMKYAEFLHDIGTVKVKPGSWKDLFFPEAHYLPGS